MKTPLLSRLYAGLAVITLAVSLSGCSNLSFSLAPEAAYPYDDYFSSKVSKDSRALVLVGVFGDELLVKAERRAAGQSTDEWIFPEGRTGLNDVHLVPVEIGKEFYISKVQVAPNPKGKNRGSVRIATITNPQIIKIDKPGIYYYGKVVFNDGLVYTNHGADPRLLELAQKKYPAAFNGSLPKIGF